MRSNILNEFKKNSKEIDLKTALYYCGFNLIEVKNPEDSETHKIKISNKQDIKDLNQLIAQTNLDYNSLNFSYDKEYNYIYLTLKEI